ncbi:hypothetical protein RI129_009701 [Pyrocoelia pectoralis]|uniref:Uncharacterized protein n=1 Tax=Pyrocoelia pectoralis TaxID=417401 RepID=A0AAN7V7V2_9COLE
MNHNVLCLVFFCCVIQIFSFEVPDKFIDTATAECLKKFNFDKTILSKYVDEKFRIINLDEVGYKLAKCAIEKGYYYNADGEFNREAIIDETIKAFELYVQREVEDKRAVSTALVDNCITRNGKDQVEEMQNFNNCLVREAQKYN